MAAASSSKPESRRAQPAPLSACQLTARSKSVSAVSYTTGMATKDTVSDPNAPATKLDIAELRSEFGEGIGNLRAEFKEDIGNLRAELLKWTLTTVITTGALIVAAVKLL